MKNPNRCGSATLQRMLSMQYTWKYFTFRRFISGRWAASAEYRPPLPSEMNVALKFHAKTKLRTPKLLTSRRLLVNARIDVKSVCISSQSGQLLQYANTPMTRHDSMVAVTEVNCWNKDDRCPEQTSPQNRMHHTPQVRRRAHKVTCAGARANLPYTSTTSSGVK